MGSNREKSNIAIAILEKLPFYKGLQKLFRILMVVPGTIIFASTIVQNFERKKNIVKIVKGSQWWRFSKTCLGFLKSSGTYDFYDPPLTFQASCSLYNIVIIFQKFSERSSTWFDDPEMHDLKSWFLLFILLFSFPLF